MSESKSGGDSDSEGGMDFDLFGDPISVVSAEVRNTGPSPNAVHSEFFWIALETQIEKSTLGRLSLSTELSLYIDDDNQNNGSVPQGVIDLCAVRIGDGYQVKRCTCPCSVKAYWLPWQRNKITVADRANVESANCSYFFTAGLSGCQFLVDPKKILHVAKSLTGGDEHKRLSGGVENALGHGEFSSVRSASDHPALRGVDEATGNVCYRANGFACGIRRRSAGNHPGGVWQYQVCDMGGREGNEVKWHKLL